MIGVRFQEEHAISLHHPSTTPFYPAGTNQFLVIMASDRFLCGPCRIRGESVYPLIVAMQWLGKHVPRQQRIVGVVFYSVRVVSKESRRLVLPRTSCLKRCGTYNNHCALNGNWNGHSSFSLFFFLHFSCY
jgi:hypothetical protein